MRKSVKIAMITGLTMMMLAGCTDEGDVSAKADTTESVVTESTVTEAVVSTEVVGTFEANEYGELDYERCFRLEKEEAGSKVCARGYLTQSLGEDEYVMEDDEGRQMMFLDARENKDVRFMVGDAIAAYGVYEQVVNVETVGGVNVDMLYITVTHLEADSSMIQAEMEAAEASVGAESDTQPDAQDEYVLYASDLVMVTDQDLEGLSQEQLRIAVNEIYARHGRKFNSEELQTYFNSKSWYQGTIAPDQFDESVLNEVEKANIQKISDKRNGTSSSGSTFEQGWIYGSYYQDLGEGGISAEIGFYSGTGEDYITLEGSYFDSYGYFSGTIVYTDYSSMYAIDENGNTIYFEYNGSSKITVTSGDNTGGMNFPGFTGTYQKTADLPKDVG